MPKPKPSAAEAEDSRFSSFTTDPRFRLPSSKVTRTKIDKRFSSRIQKDDDFANTAKVDRYGRKLSSKNKKKALERLYEPEDEDVEEEENRIEVEDDDVVQKELLSLEKASYDPARGGGFSSSSEDDEESEEEAEEEEGIEEAEFPDLQAEQAEVEEGEVSSRIAVVNLDWDNIRSVDIMAVFSSFVRPGGKIKKISIYQSDFGRERMQREELEGPPKEIFAKPTKDDEEDDSEEEEDSDAESEDSEEADEKIRKDLQKEDMGEDFDGAALRQYQLERLRYFYAVVVCSDNNTAHHLYEAIDGTEYLSSANFFDLRFIPDGTEFEGKPRDECESVPAGYRPVEFVTDALQHSKVKLTWDMDPEEASRKDAIQRAFTGSRADIGENDLKAYLGSDSESSEEEDEEEEQAEEDAPKLSKKELARQKMRAALGLPDVPAVQSKKKGAAPVGDMEITFTAGLSTNSEHNVFENEPVIDETTAERYLRKERERKNRRREKAKAIRLGLDPNGTTGQSGKGEDKASDGEDQASEKEDLGFDDPFFNMGSSEHNAKSKKPKSKSKEERQARRLEKEAEAKAAAAQKADLELLLQDDALDAGDRLDHFDMKEITRAEKQARKGKKGRGKKGKEGEEVESKRGGLQKDFEIDVKDERFAGRLYGDHEFAIDASSSKFKGTEGMKKVLAEGRVRRGADTGEMEVGDAKGAKGKGKRAREAEKGTDSPADSSQGLSALVESVKKKAKR